MHFKSDCSAFKNLIFPVSVLTVRGDSQVTSPFMILKYQNITFEKAMRSITKNDHLKDVILIQH